MAQKIPGAKISDVSRPRKRERVAQPGEGRAYYHYGGHASHYVKVMLDQIFWEN
jgi:hypothetical protein